MIWLDLLLRCGWAVDQVLSAADLWGPVALWAAITGWGAHRAARASRDTRPDTSGRDPDSPADIQARLPA